MESVGADVGHGDQVARGEGGQFRAARPGVERGAERARHDGVQLGGGVGAAGRADDLRGERREAAQTGHPAEVVDAGGEDDDVPVPGALHVQDGCHQRAGGADEVAARLEHKLRRPVAPAGQLLVEEPLQAGAERGEVDGRTRLGERRAEPSAEVQDPQPRTLACEQLRQLPGGVQGAPELAVQGVDLGEVGAHVQVQSDDRRPGPVPEPLRLARHPAGVRAELRGDPGHDQALTGDRLVVVDPQQALGRDPGPGGDPVQLLDRVGRVDGEQPHAPGQGLAELVVGLAGPGVQDVGGVPAGVERRVQLAGGADLGPGAAPAQGRQQRRVRVRLQRVVQAGAVRQGRAQQRVVAAHLGRVVDVRGHRDARQVGQWDRQHAGALLNRGHGTPRSPGRPAPCGRPSRCR